MEIDMNNPNQIALPYRLGSSCRVEQISPVMAMARNSARTDKIKWIVDMAAAEDALDPHPIPTGKDREDAYQIGCERTRAWSIARIHWLAAEKLHKDAPPPRKITTSALLAQPRPKVAPKATPAKPKATPGLPRPRSPLAFMRQLLVGGKPIERSVVFQALVDAGCCAVTANAYISVKKHVERIGFEIRCFRDDSKVKFLQRV
jgi:hypothetical protein